MARTSCPACGAPVDVADVRDPRGHDFTVALEVNEDASSEAPRYRITGYNPLRAERLPASAPRGLPDHSFDCPGANAGRR